MKYNINELKFDKNIYKPATKIQYNDFYNNEILEIIKKYPARFGSILKNINPKKHKSYYYLYTYILKCTEHMPFENFTFSQKIFWVLNKWQDFPICEYPECNTRLIIDNRYKAFRLSVDQNGKLINKWPRHCCNKHAQNNPHTRQKCINTCRKKFGCDNPYQSDKIKLKCKEKHIKNYNVDVPAKSHVILNRMKQTCIKKYGVENIFQHQSNRLLINTPEIIEKRICSIKKTNIKKYGVPWYVMSDKFKEQTKTTYGASKEEYEVYNYLSSLTNDKIICGSFKIINPYQLDFYIPSKNIAFEFNGIYYHSILKLTDINYHLNKTILCEKIGIKLIHIWENEWYDNPEYKLFIKNILQDNIKFNFIDEIVEIDRSQYNKCWNIPGYKLIDETAVELITRSKRKKDKYVVANCGKLIYKRIQ